MEVLEWASFALYFEHPCATWDVFSVIFTSVSDVLKAQTITYEYHSLWLPLKMKFLEYQIVWYNVLVWLTSLLLLSIYPIVQGSKIVLQICSSF